MRRRHRGARSAALVAAVALLGVLGTWAALQAETANVAGGGGAGAGAVTDDDAGTAMFAVSGMAAGDSETKCVLVTYTGDVTGTVRLYGTVSGSAASTLTVGVEKGSGATPGATHSCTGFTPSSTLLAPATMNTFASTWATGYDGASFTQGETAVYRFTVALPAGTTCAAGCSQDASATFTWEARNT